MFVFVVGVVVGMVAKEFIINIVDSVRDYFNV